MASFYVPHKLMDEKEEIKLVHSNSFTASDLAEDSLFVQFIRTLAKLNSDEVVSFAKKQDPELITKLSGYICTNSKNLLEDNFNIALYNFASPEDWNIILEDWENHYRNSNVQSLLSSACYGVNENWVKCLEEKKLVPMNLSWLDSGEIIDAVCEFCDNSSTSEEFCLKLYSRGVIKDTDLFNACKEQFLLYCSGDAYLNFGDVGVRNGFSGLDSKNKRRFVLNLVKQLSVEQLAGKFKYTYDAIAQYLKTLENLNETKKILEKVSLWDKFIKWETRMKLDIAFAGDKNRYDFWVKYIEVGYFDFKDPNVLLMDFGNIIVTEFKGRAAGPAYVMSKDFYDKNVKWKLTHYSKSEFQSFLLNAYDMNMDGMYERMPHNGGGRNWWSHFWRELKRYGIIESIN